MFRDRTDAGRLLATRLSDYPLSRPLVLALPRGGVPVAVEVGVALGADIDVLVVRKLGAPGNPEFAIGALGEDDALVVDHATVHDLRVTDEQLEHLAAEARAEVERRVQTYRLGGRRVGIASRNIIIVDDGLATGSTAAAAVRLARHQGAAHITVAVPVGSREAVDRIAAMADAVVCVETPDPFHSVGEHYRSFAQVSDDDVVALLRAHPRRDNYGREASTAIDRDVLIPVHDRALAGRLTLPADPRGVVVFAHGSGSTRLSPRNTAVAHKLQVAGLGTLLFDLLTDEESDVRRTVFDIELLAERLIEATSWLSQDDDAAGLSIGYFGASTGAAAALVAAGQSPDDIAAVVSRGGRPDLAGPWLAKVAAPTLLIVGSLDHAVVDLNRAAQRHLTCPSLLEIVPGATHLFEEPGTLTHVARLARGWFLEHLHE